MQAKCSSAFRGGKMVWQPSSHPPESTATASVCVRVYAKNAGSNSKGTRSFDSCAQAWRCPLAL